MLDPFWTQLAWRQLWQVSLTIVAIWLIVRMCARHQPRLAYLLWMLVVVKCVTPPVWGSPVGLFSWMQVNSNPRVLVSAPLKSTHAINPIGVDKPTQIDDVKTIRVDGPGPMNATQDAKEEQAKILTWSLGFPVLTAVWLAGVLAIGLRLRWSWNQFHRSLQLEARLTAVTHVEAQVKHLAGKLSVWRVPRIVLTEQTTVPAVFGFLRPTIVLPESLLKPELKLDLEPILAHELVHLHRADTLAGRLQLVVQTLYWFHPLVWWANFETRRERERACDEMVITLMGYDPLRYAQCLVRVAELSEEIRAGGPRYQASCVAAVTSFRLLADRLKHITVHATEFRRRISWVQIVVACSLAAVLLPGTAATSFNYPSRHTVVDSTPNAASALNLAVAIEGETNNPFASADLNTHRAVAHAPVLAGITIDGTLDDWPTATPRHAFFKILADGSKSWEGTDFSTSPDLSCVFMLGYSPDEQLLYVAVIVRDDKLVIGNSSDDDTDAVELYFDGLRSRRIYPWRGGIDPLWFETVELRDLPVQEYCAIPGPGTVYGSSKKTNPLLAAGDLEKTRTKMAFTRTGDIITYEWAVEVFDRYPNQPTRLKPGKRIGFDIAVVDKDVPLMGRVEDESPTDRRAWIYWGPNWRGTKTFDASSLGEIVLD